MKFIHLSILFVALASFGACQTTPAKKELKPKDIVTTGPIEITKYIVTNIESTTCSMSGKLVDDYGEAMVFVNITFEEHSFGTTTDMDGNYKLANIPEGNYTLKINQIDSSPCAIELEFSAGDHIELNATIARYARDVLLKPIIYIYPEAETEVEIALNYDGKVTTTYPIYSVNGWKVTARPDGTLIDKNGKEYYALYWEGEPRNPLEIHDGFVVAKAQTIPFLEEKLAVLGLNAREANEFIIFWLPILEKNEFNLIHFAADDYLDQAQLTITPTPETVIRIAMVFQGLDEEIDFPTQDLSPLMKMRKGFTVVEWGGEQKMKKFKPGI